ncbi:hypothetical protein LINGRAHAP2_LOCUS6477 [Linum grandiflorum]
MEENRQMMKENHHSLEGLLDELDQNHQEIALQLTLLDERYESYNSRVDRRVGMRELPPRGGNSAPTFNILADQPPMHGVCQHPPIPMERAYVTPANMEVRVGLSGGDHMPPHAYPRPMPPQFNGQAWTP